MQSVFGIPCEFLGNRTNLARSPDESLWTIQGLGLSDGQDWQGGLHPLANIIDLLAPGSIPGSIPPGSIPPCTSIPGSIPPGASSWYYVPPVPLASVIGLLVRGSITGPLAIVKTITVVKTITGEPGHYQSQMECFENRLEPISARSQALQHQGVRCRLVAHRFAIKASTRWRVLTCNKARPT